MSRTKNALLSLATLATSISLNAAPDWAKKGDTVEKCLGVSKAKQNDCGSKANNHPCSGKAKKDNDPNEWIYVPAGLCNKLTGGKIKETKKI